MATQAFKDFFEVSIRNESKLKQSANNDHRSLVIISEQRKEFFRNLLLAHHDELQDLQNLVSRSRVAYLCSYYYPTGLKLLFEKGYYGSVDDLKRTRTLNHPIMNETMTQFGSLMEGAFVTHPTNYPESESSSSILKSICEDFLSLIKYLKENFPDFLKTRDEYGKYPYQQLDVWNFREAEPEYSDFTEKLLTQASHPAKIKEFEDQITEAKYDIQLRHMALTEAEQKFQEGQKSFQRLTFPEYKALQEKKIEKLKEKKADLERTLSEFQ